MLQGLLWGLGGLALLAFVWAVGLPALRLYVCVGRLRHTPLGQMRPHHIAELQRHVQDTQDDR